MPVSYSRNSAGPSTRRTRVVLGPEQIKDLSYYDMTKTELQAEAEKRGLLKSGNKDVLIQRLQASD